MIRLLCAGIALCMAITLGGCTLDPDTGKRVIDWGQVRQHVQADIKCLAAGKVVLDQIKEKGGAEAFGLKIKPDAKPVDVVMAAADAVLSGSALETIAPLLTACADTLNNLGVDYALIKAAISKSPPAASPPK